MMQLLEDIQDSYSLPVQGSVELIAGGAGQNCTYLCEQWGKGCQEDLGLLINTYKTLQSVFAERCNGKCSQLLHCRQGAMKLNISFTFHGQQQNHFSVATL